MRWSALLALLLLVPGCLEEASAPAGLEGGGEGAEDAEDGGREGRQARSGDGGSEDADPDAIYRYEGSFDLIVNPDSVVAVSVGGVSEGNCVLFWDTGGADYAFVNGTATLDWAALTPLAETLALYMIDGGGASATGTSPLTLAINPMSPDHWGSGFAADIPLGSATAQQAVRLTLAFDYQGDLPSPGVGSCSNGP